MRPYALVLLAACVAGGVSAQNRCDPCGPGIHENGASRCLAVAAFNTYTNPPIYLSPAPSRKWIQQIKTVQPRGATRNVNGSTMPVVGSRYLTYLTVYGVDQRYGNSQGSASSFLIGGAHDRERDAQVGCFTPAFLPDPCSTRRIAECFRTNLSTGGNFGMMVEGSSGLDGVADHGNGPVYFNRPSVNSAFGNPARITSISGTYVDPDIELRAGRRYLWWAAPNVGGNPNRILCAPLNVSTYSRCGTSTVAVSGRAVTYVVPCQSSTTLVVAVHSPTIITDAQGTAIGMLHSERVGNDSDEFWKANLSVGQAGQPHPQTGPFFDNTAWTNNGGEAGGTMYYADSASPFYEDIHYSRGCFLSGGTDPVGSAGATLKVNLDDRGPATTNFAVVLLGLAGRIPPTKIPSFGGTLCLNPQVFPLCMVTPIGANEVGRCTLPDLSSFRPLSLPAQALCIDSGGPAAIAAGFSNVGFVDIQ